MVELGFLAFECSKHNGLHCNDDVLIVESVGTKHPKLIATSLFAKAMPLIRYDTGDCGVKSEEQCSCGRSFSLIKEFLGREDDFIKLPSGKVISPRNINILDEVQGIKQYQIIQEKTNMFCVNVIKSESFSEDTHKKIKQTIIKGCGGEKVNVRINLVNKLPRTKSGKIRTVISKVKK